MSVPSALAQAAQTGSQNGSQNGCQNGSADPDIADAWLAGGEAVRVRLATRAATPASVLHRLAQDPSPTVRAAVAMNPTFAPEADKHLLADEDERIRILLAGKLAALLPGLSRASQAAAVAHVGQALETMADDVATRVRVALAEALAHMPEAPRSVMLRLARDPMHLVSDPVLRLCPLLTDADLLDLLATPPHDRVGHSVAARPGLAAPVADQIAGLGHPDVVRILLQNHSAVIQEKTLDTLIARAADNPDWHEPLISRPALPRGATQSLLSMIARDLRTLLAVDGDLTPAVERTLVDGLAAVDAAAPLPPPASPHLALAMDPRPEHALMSAIQAGDLAQAKALLAAQADVPMASVEHATALRSSKALVSLVWKAGFSPAAARALLAMVGLKAGDWTDLFPFSASEMEWQIELLDRPHGEASQAPAGRATRSTTAGSPRVTT